MATLANKNEIFYIPVGRYFNKKEDEVNIIYAPLKGKFMLATNQMCIELEKAFANNTTDSKAINTKDAICQTQDIDFDKLTHGIESLYEIEILANNTCNFSCVYCYSAKGRSTQRLDFQNFKTLIDFLFNGNHFPKRTYAIHFSGGGESLLSFDFIKEGNDIVRFYFIYLDCYIDIFFN